jgi:hypothetical protein
MPLEALDNEQIEVSFQRYINASSNHQALMISGKWGTGKTHFFHSHLRPVAEKTSPKLKILYISLNGISNIDQVDRALFVAAYPLFKKGIVQAAGAAFKDLIGLTSIKLDEILKVEASINKSTLICIDDLERLERKLLGQVLGKISTLLEIKEAKVLLICDEGKLKTSAIYNNGKEKIVGRTLLYSPSLENVVATTLDVLKSALERTPVLKIALENGVLSQALTRILKSSKCRNMRLSISAIRCFCELIESMSPDLQDRYKNNLHQLLHTTVAVSLQLNEAPDTAERIERVFSAPDSEMFDMYASGAASSDPGVAFIERVLDSKEAPPIYAYEIFRFVRDGFCDAALFSAQLATLLKPDEIREPLQRIERFWKLSQEEFDKTVNDVLQQLDAMNFSSLNVLNRITYVLFHLSKKNLIGLSSQEIMDRVLKAGNTYVKQALSTDTPAELLEANLAPLANDHHSRAIDNFRLMSQKLSAQNWEKKKKQLFQLIRTDSAKFSEELRAPAYARAQIFTSSEDVVIVGALLKELFLKDFTDTEKLFKVSNAFSRRYLPEDMNSILKEERTFLNDLSSSLERIEEEIPADHSLARSALSDIQAAIRLV